jgi:hypothetical protein
MRGARLWLAFCTLFSRAHKCSTLEGLVRTFGSYSEHTDRELAAEFKKCLAEMKLRQCLTVPVIQLISSPEMWEPLDEWQLQMGLVTAEQARRASLVSCERTPHSQGSGGVVHLEGLLRRPR